MNLEDLIKLARTTDFKVGDRVVEIGGGNFKAIVTSIDYPYLYVRYDGERRTTKSYHDNYRKLTKLEKALS